MTDNDYILDFQKKYGKEKYDSIEQSSPLFQSRVQLKKGEPLLGKIERLWLPADTSSSRPSDIWLAHWDNGKVGLVEEKNIILI